MDPRDLSADWPFRSASRRLLAGPHDWWLADLGPADAAPVLMLHGLGASGQSFRRTAPPLAGPFRVLIPDLPGQGCTRCGAPARLALPAIAEDLWALCDRLEIHPAAIVGHSAGAAVALQMALVRPVPRVVGLNAALGSFDGPAGLLFPMLARGLAALPFVPQAVARLWGTERKVRELLAMTGSPADAETVALYLRLVRDPDHIAGALGMMARWNLSALLTRLPQLAAQVLLIAGSGDTTVPPRVSRDAARRIPGAALMELPGGHLLHEERPDGLSGPILDLLQTGAVSPKIRAE